jgi:hypothetical protein
MYNLPFFEADTVFIHRQITGKDRGHPFHTYAAVEPLAAGKEGRKVIEGRGVVGGRMKEGVLLLKVERLLKEGRKKGY